MEQRPIVPTKNDTYRACQRKSGAIPPCSRRLITFTNLRGEVKSICPKHGTNIQPEGSNEE